MSEQGIQPSMPMSGDEAARLSHRNATNEARQELQTRIIQETDKREHVGHVEDEECRKMVEELQNWEPGEGDPRLTDWEVGFLDDVIGFPLLYSVKQADKIKIIWGRIYG